MSNELEYYLVKNISWEQTGNPRFPYASEFEGEKLTIRVNNFPDEPLYTLIINKTEEFDFDDWSANWERPAKASQVAYHHAVEY